MYIIHRLPQLSSFTAAPLVLQVSLKHKQRIRFCLL